MLSKRRFGCAAFEIVLAPLALLLLMEAPGVAATYYVDAQGGDDSYLGTSPSQAWESIAHVNAQSYQPGDNILFERGETWIEGLIVPSSGSPLAAITFGAYGAGVLPRIVGSGGSASIIIDAKGYLIVENLDLSGGSVGVLIHGSNQDGSITLSRLDVHHTTDNNGISVADRGHMNIDRCIVHDCGGNGISFHRSPLTAWDDLQAHDVEIENTEIRDCVKNGLYLAGHNAKIHQNTITGNGKFDPRYHNVYLIGDGAVVEKNLLLGSPAGDGFRFEGSGLRFRYNYVSGNAKHALGFWNDFPHTLVDNEVYGNVLVVEERSTTSVSNQSGIHVGDDHAAGVGEFNGLKLYNNTFFTSGAQTYGVFLSKGANVELKNNIIDAEFGCALVRSAAAIGFTSEQNIYNRGAFCYACSAAQTFEEWKILLGGCPGAGNDCSSELLDPEFSDRASEDLTLQSGSPCIDNGADLGSSYEEGLQPTSVWPGAVSTLSQALHGTAWEIGAYVFVSAAGVDAGVDTMPPDARVDVEDVDGGTPSDVGVDVEDVDGGTPSDVGVDVEDVDGARRDLGEGTLDGLSSHDRTPADDLNIGGGERGKTLSSGCGCRFGSSARDMPTSSLLLLVLVFLGRRIRRLRG